MDTDDGPYVIAQIPRDQWSMLSHDGQISPGPKKMVQNALWLFPDQHGSLWIETAGWSQPSEGAVGLPALDGIEVLFGRVGDGDYLSFAKVEYQWKSGELFRTTEQPTIPNASGTTSQPGLVLSNVSSPGVAGSPRFEDVSFTIPRGQMTIICGPSGSGKSSLLEVICGYRPINKGHITFGDQLFDASRYFASGWAALVPQQPEVMPDLTTEQVLHFAYRLRLGRNDRNELNKLVTASLARAELTHRKDKLVAVLSGGEIKRLSLAIELITSPDLVLLDEPNSGLDAYRDRILMQVLRDDVARLSGRSSGQSVLVVTHILDHATTLHDKALALAGGPNKDPYIAYAGPGDKMMDTLVSAKSGTNQKSADLMALLGGHQKKPGSQTSLWPPKAKDPDLNGTTSDPPPPPHKDLIRYTPPRGRLTTLIEREWKRQHALTKPDKSHLWKAMLVEVLIPFILGLVVVALAAKAAKADFGPDNPKSLAAFLIMSTLLCFIAISYTAPSIMGDWPFLRREHRWGIPPVDQVMARFFSVLPRGLVLSVVVGAGMSFTRPPAASAIDWPIVVAYCSITVTLTIASLAFGLLLGTVTSQIRQVMICLLIVLALMTILSGCALPLLELLPSPWLAYSLPSLIPTRWAGAAWCSLTGIFQYPGKEPVADELWQNTAGSFVRALLAPLVLTVLYLGVATWRLRKLASKPPRN